jgi:hypothetical protein
MLGYKEEEIWSMTPRKFYSQLLVYREMHSGTVGNTNDKAQSGFIDQIPGW